MADIILALGFDLFFKPKINDAAARAGVEVRYASARDAPGLAASATRVIADASAPGVAEALDAIRRARADLPILACYPHVEAQRARELQAIGGIAVTRGKFAERIGDALAGTLA